MRPGALETVATVRTFLAEELRPAVPPELASELRAAIKLLATAEQELAGLADVLRDEAGDLLLACTDALRYVDPPEGVAAYDGVAKRDLAAMDLHELTALQRGARDLNAGVLVALQRHCRDAAVPDVERRAARTLLAHFYELLGAQAQRRVPWQSVFAPDTATVKSSLDASDAPNLDLTCAESDGAPGAPSKPVVDVRSLAANRSERGS